MNTVPVRFTGYELSDQKILLHMDIHHIAFDGRSVMIWSKDLFDILRGNTLQPEAHENGDLKVSFSYDLQTLLRDMNITMHRHDGCMDLTIRYASRLFEDTLIKRFLEQLQFTLNMMAEKPDVSIDCVSVLPPAQAEKVAGFSDAAQSGIVDRHGCPVPVGVTGRVVRQFTNRED